MPVTGETAQPGPRTLLVIAPWARRDENAAEMAAHAHFVRGFTTHGWRVLDVSPRDPEYGFHDVYAATQRWPAWLRRLVWPVAFTMLATVRALQLARHTKPDAVLGQTHFSSLAAFLVSMVCGVPSAMKLPGVGGLGRPAESHAQHLRRNPGMMAALRIPHDLWLVIDDGTRGDVALRNHGVPSEKIRVLPIGVDPAWASQAGDGASFRSAFNLAVDARVLLWFAHPAGADNDVLHAFALARARAVLPLALVMVGVEPGVLLQSPEVQDGVHTTGIFDHDRVPDAMAASYLLLATSRSSNKSAAVCEAMLCGVPVVAFDAGGTSDVVRDGETGRLVPDGDVETLAEAIVALVESESARDSLAAGARAFARERFTGWERRVEMERELLERLIARQRG
ncbi:MAG: glycosyltransferase family 4 protein [Candidatus Krumholzibacteria bacterium]|nr:glycosyltransferase family 4 protein [Candidatus Krumholzibacteria bacterium]